MSTIYIVSNNGKMNKKGESLIFNDYDGTVTTLFPHTIDQLFIVGMVEITGQAMHVLMKNSIETIFISRNGRYDGKLVFQDAKNVFLRRKQYFMLDDDAVCLSFSKSIVRGKLKNQFLFMQRIARKYEKSSTTAHALQRMEDLQRKLETCDSIDQVRGIEGYGAVCYFSVFKQNIIQDWAEFNGRSKNPPRDNVNAVLSFLYTLVSYRMDSLIVAEGLDNAVGILHSLSYGRKSLVFDLMEEFRTPLVDTLTCALFNMATLKKEDFHIVEFSRQIELDDADTLVESRDSEQEEIILPGEASKGVLLTKEGLKKVVMQFERKLDDEHMYEPLGKRLDYKRIMHEQIKQYKRFVMGLEESYKPVVIT